MNESRALPRAVLDTNIYISGTILARGTPFAVLEAWRQQQYILITSEAIIVEIERVLHYPRIGQRYSITNQDVTRLIDSLQAESLVVAGDYEVSGVSPDPDDDKFLACALEGRADYIVTGDPHLLNLKQYHGIYILKPHKFLNRLSYPGDR
jgi:putative PIN family toxin of toxin-antitoxin system